MILSVGLKLWLVSSNMTAREVTVSKIGRKWAEIEGGRSRIDKNELWVDGRGYSSPGRCYVSREVYETQKAAGEAWSSLRQAMRSHRPSGVTAEDIQAARKLLGLADDT